MSPSFVPKQHQPGYPLLYQLNTRVLLTSLADTPGRSVTLDDIPDELLDRLAAAGFDWVWMLSIWRTGSVGQGISRNNSQWRDEFRQAVPDLREEDIAGSGFAIVAYTVDPRFGGPSALQRLRERLRLRGMRMMLDFVPNHTAIDHVWVKQHPDYYIEATQEERARAPDNYAAAGCYGLDRTLAHGRDPYFPGWPDTLQLNYGNPATHAAMIQTLQAVAGQCDGVRCDMAMLLLPDVFERTWGRAMPAFWPCAIQAVRREIPQFCFMAEAYWDREWDMLQQGFDYTYDKRLYDRLRQQAARPVREHLQAGIDYQRRLARFLENHDEPRAAATFPPDVHHAAAVITYLSPGLRFFHQGQIEGYRTHISPHLVRAPHEPADAGLRDFYLRLLAIAGDPVLRDGSAELLVCAPAWDGNWTWDCFVAWCWRHAGRRLLAVVNYAGNQSQCLVRIPWDDERGHVVVLRDVNACDEQSHDGEELAGKGLYVDLPPWGWKVWDAQCPSAQ